VLHTEQGVLVSNMVSRMEALVVIRPTIVNSNLLPHTLAVTVLTTTSTSSSDIRIHKKTLRHGENSV
jgi:hypothetical protein